MSKSTTSQEHSGRVSFLRHSAWVGPEDFDSPINIVGCGAVGSHVAVAIAKMGAHKFQLWDADVVENHNLSNQAYDMEHVGMPKVLALEQVLKRFNPHITVTTHERFFYTKDDADLLDGPLVIATDNMSSRMDLVDAFNLNLDVSGVFEIRLGFDYGECHVIDNLDFEAVKVWKNTLKPDSEVPDGPCNQRICTTLVQLTSAYLAHQIAHAHAVSRQQVAWEFDKRMVFSMKDRLMIRSINN